MNNNVSQAIKPLMSIAALLGTDEFLSDVADALEEAKKEDKAKMVRLIVTDPEKRLTR